MADNDEQTEDPRFVFSSLDDADAQISAAEAVLASARAARQDVVIPDEVKVLAVKLHDLLCKRSHGAGYCTWVVEEKLIEGNGVRSRDLWHEPSKTHRFWVNKAYDLSISTGYSIETLVALMGKIAACRP